MTNLLEEYRQRHNIHCVCPINEGLLFLESSQNLPIIVLTSSPSKQLFLCENCGKEPEKIIIEAFTSSSFPNCCQKLLHTHLSPDEDLLKCIADNIPDGDLYTPYISCGERDQERWLWNTFIKNGFFKDKSFQQFNKTLNQKSETYWIEQVCWFMENKPAVLNYFYERMYSVVMVGKKYILVRN